MPGAAAQLATSAAAKLQHGFRPSTLRQYHRLWTDFLAFQVAAGLPLKVTVEILLSFLEYLHQNTITSAHMQNYLAALRSLHILHGLDTSPFRDQRLALYVKATQLQAPFTPKRVNLLDIHVLEQVIQQCDFFQFPIIFKTLYLLLFFSFLRLSNVLPHSINTFDNTRHLARGDVIFSQDGALILIKWSKTIQDRKNFATIAIPDLGASSLCPIKALRLMFHLYPAHEDSPLFLLPRPTQSSPLTDSTARKHLKDISKALALPSSITFHDFRRAGASWAFHQGVPIEHIRSHGTWKSDAIWSYLSSAVSSTSPVALAFRRVLHH